MPGDSEARKYSDIMTYSSPKPWHEGLMGAARRVAETPDSPLRVLAGPGTGKTFALMRRVARLLQTGARAERVLVCTFTRTAAQDLEKELSSLGTTGASDVHAGTLHSLCFGLLSKKHVLQITGRVPRPLLEFEERFLLEDLNGNGFGGIHDRRRHLKAFNAAWARLQYEEPGWPLSPVDQAFQDALVGWLRFHEAMLIGELVPETLRFLRNNPAIPERSAFDHVLVDEFQDLNRAEQELVYLLAGAASLTIVGDDNQSIYSFKHAHPQGIIAFPTEHPNTHQESLEECRRCPQLVVELANTLIANNTEQVKRRLLPRPSNPPGEVRIVQWTSREEEAQGIAQFIATRVRAGAVGAGNVLVLSPRRQFGYAVRDALDTLKVPAHSFFHEEALEGNPKQIAESAAQQAFTLLTLLANPDDRVALRCWCGFGSDSLRREAWSRLRSTSEETGLSPRAVLDELALGNRKLPHSAPVVNRYRDLQAQLATLNGTTGGTLLDALFPESAAWAAPFRALATAAEEESMDATRLREVLRVGITQPELPTDVDYVRVMSLHKSKGLNADLVVVLGCIEGLIPYIAPDLTPVEQQAALEEQRRLFYVAITRTRQTLVLSSVTQLPRDVAYQMLVPVVGGNQVSANTIASRFISELGPACPQPRPGSTILRSTL